MYLVFDHLKTEDFKKTPKGVEAALGTLPKNVGEVYEQILNRSKDRHMVQKVLKIILAAIRPLTLAEMNVAVNIEDASVSQSFESLDLEEEEHFKSRLRSWCGLFVSVYNDRVYLLHQTAREFLLAELSSQATVPSELRWCGSITAFQGHRLLTDLCVVYLEFFNSDGSLLTAESGNTDCEDTDKEDTDRRAPKRAFLAYAAEAWVTHFRESDIADNDAIVPVAARICDPRSKSYSTWFKPFWREIWWDMEPVSRTPCSHPAELAVPSCFGLNAIVKLLIRMGADIEEMDGRFSTPLSWAVRQGHIDTVRLLLNEGAKVVSASEEHWSSLHWAIKTGNEAMVRLLLDKGADVEERDRFGYGGTALSRAAESGREDIARLLLERGANMEPEDKWMLLERGANIEPEDKWPLYQAAEKGHDAIVRLLLDKGASTKTKPHTWTVLHAAAQEKQYAVAKLLLERGLDVNARANNGETPFLTAVLNRAGVDFVRLLLQHGADINAKDRDGRTAAWHAANSPESEEIVRIIRTLGESGANLDAKDKRGDLPLYRAADGGFPRAVQALIECGANIYSHRYKSREEWVQLAYNRRTENQDPSLSPFGYKVRSGRRRLRLDTISKSPTSCTRGQRQAFPDCDTE